MGVTYSNFILTLDKLSRSEAELREGNVEGNFAVPEGMVRVRREAKRRSGNKKFKRMAMRNHRRGKKGRNGRNKRRRRQ